MLSLSARIGAPVIGFVLGLLVTYGLADAGPGPVPSRILQDVLAPRIPIGSRPIGDAKFAERSASFGEEFDERLASLEERFMGARPQAKTVETKKAAVTQSGTGMRLTSLEMPVSSKSVLSDIDSPKFAALRTSSGDRSLLDGRTDSFDERFAGARAPTKAMDDPKEGASHVSLPEPSWAVQLIGDSSEATALSLFRELQNKHKSLLGIYNPVVLRTALRPGSEPIWTRVRVELSSRQAAESLCSKLEAAGERCFVQRAPASLPSNAVTASAKSPVETPLR
jgi:hypothetical protein